MTITLWPSNHDHRIVTIESWPSNCDYRIVTIESWPSHCEPCIVSIASRALHREPHIVTIALWALRCEYRIVTISSWSLPQTPNALMQVYLWQFSKANGYLYCNYVHLHVCFILTLTASKTSQTNGMYRSTTMLMISLNGRSLVTCSCYVDKKLKNSGKRLGQVERAEVERCRAQQGSKFLW